MTGRPDTDVSSDWVLREQNRLRPELTRALHRVLFERDDWVLGEELEEFEREFAAFLGTPHGVGVSSGTDALTLALLALGVGWGDAVILPALTYVATGLAVLRVGATPVFVDVEPERWVLDVGLIGRAMATGVKAVIPVHVFGRSANMPELMSRARDFGLTVIEDACQGHGAEYDCRRTGTWGDAGCFSFFPTKTLGGCGDGGFICSPSAEIAERVRLLRSPGRNVPEEQHSLRYNHRLDTLQAAVLRVKLRYLGVNIGRRRALRDRIVEGLESVGICAGDRPDDAPTEVVLLVPERDRLLRHLKRAGCAARAHWPTILPDLPVFSRVTPQGEWPVSRIASRSLLSLVIHPEMTDEEADWVVAEVKACFRPEGTG